ncbi:pyridoxal-phosphate dependent enzyme [Phenylobacterium sp.]|uniref:pyridoxal-phosphate dependent enzyme n=1 Tax=Phenylobacterium sp. TaxID=1871053 RepID=UPI0027375EF9|nr:pyridoxal-phosphate dependent enzyme [Phenylobacterium sp.]MDP3855349.1 pyridoxal-phosphate dependent enzyme [Phenylobacterium sp.]
MTTRSRPRRTRRGEGLKAVTAPGGRVVVVEPARAACVAAALAAGRPVRINGDLHTCAEMLSCGLASAPALQVLLRHGASAVAVSEAQLLAAVAALESGGGPASTPSGAAGLAGLLHVAVQPDLREAYGLDEASVVLLVATEAALEQNPI